MEKVRNAIGQFAPKQKKLRRLYLSDKHWEILADIATSKGITPSELIERELCKE